MPDADRERTWNQGVGMVAVVAATGARHTVAALTAAGMPAWVLGEVVANGEGLPGAGVSGAKGVAGGTVHLTGAHPGW